MSDVEVFPPRFLHRLLLDGRIWHRIYFYSKTNQIQNTSNLFYFGTTLHMFRTVSPSNIRSLRLYIQQRVYVI